MSELITHTSQYLTESLKRQAALATIHDRLVRTVAELDALGLGCLSETLLLAITEVQLRLTQPGA